MNDDSFVLREKFNDFVSFLQLYPSMGLKHIIGQRIDTFISLLPKVKIHKSDWFRARNPCSASIYRKSDLAVPDMNKIEVKEGRFNHYALPELYLSKSRIGAASETLSYSSGITWIQKYSEVKLHSVAALCSRGFDKSEPDDPFFEELLYNITYKVSPFRKFHKPEYLITRFVLDVCRYHKFDGILIESVYELSQNLVITNTQFENYTLLEEPELYQYVEDFYDPSLYKLSPEKIIDECGYLFLDKKGFL